MTDDEVLRVLDDAAIQLRQWQRDHGQCIGTMEVLAKLREAKPAVAALQAERDALCDDVARLDSDIRQRIAQVLANGQAASLAEQRAERAESALEAMRGQVEGLATEFSENATHSRHKQAVEVWAYIGQKLAALLAIKERMG